HATTKREEKARLHVPIVRRSTRARRDSPSRTTRERETRERVHAFELEIDPAGRDLVRALLLLLFLLFARTVHAPKAEPAIEAVHARPAWTRRDLLAGRLSLHFRFGLGWRRRWCDLHTYHLTRGDLDVLIRG